MAVQFWGVKDVPSDSCQWMGSMLGVGDSVDDLANALVALPGRGAEGPVPTSVGGFDGVFVELRVPDEADFEECDNSWFISWLGNAGAGVRFHQQPGQVDRIWILDLDGKRLVIDGFYLGATPEEDRAQIDEIVSSIRFVDS